MRLIPDNSATSINKSNKPEGKLGLKSYNILETEGIYEQL